MYPGRNIIAFFLCLQFVACSKQSPAPVVIPGPTPPVVAPPPVVVPPIPKRFLALGDSYTIGASVSAADRFPNQTGRWLLDNEVVGYDQPEIIATSGWTTANLQYAITQQQPAGPYDVVSLLIGVNDQYQRLSLEGYRTRFRELLQKAIQLAGNRPGRVFVLSIPDYSVTPFAQNMDTERIRQEINAFNAANLEISNTLQVKYLDITASTREALNDRNLLAADGLHPSGMEYGKWASRLGPLMKEALR